MPTVRLDLSYDGTDFHGYAKQLEVRTVQEVLEEALQRLFGEIHTTVAGRTDAGVHARHQVVSFATDKPIDVKAVRRSLNSMLPDDVAVHDVSTPADERFSARFSAKKRTYRYLLLNRQVPDPMRRRFMWHLGKPLDGFAMNQSARHFVGEHDFASFCRKAPRRPTVRTVTSARWTEPAEDELQFEISGYAFCHQMVRSIVGTMIDIGIGRIHSSKLAGILEARNRDAAGGVAPPTGLVLWEVGYEGRRWDAPPP